MEDDLTGLRFGKLTAIRVDKERSAVKFQRCWLCRCECGNMVIVEQYRLKHHFKTSCGCENGNPKSMASFKFRQAHGCMYCAERKDCPQEYCKYENQLRGNKT